MVQRGRRVYLVPHVLENNGFSLWSVKLKSDSDVLPLLCVSYMISLLLSLVGRRSSNSKLPSVPTVSSVPEDSASNMR